MRPSILSMVILIFVRGIEAFDIPLFIGVNARIIVFTTTIYKILVRHPVNYGLATAYSMILFAIGLVAIYLYRRALGASQKYVTVTGKGYRPRMIDLGKWKYPVAGITLIVLLLIYVFPYGMLMLMSFVRRFSYGPTWEVFGRLTLENYQDVLTEPDVLPSFSNSLFLGAAGATMLMLLVTISTYSVTRAKTRGVSAIEGIAMLPMAFPAVMVAVGLMWTYLVWPIGIYGTIWILMVGYMTKYLPYGMRTMSGAIYQIHHDLEDSSRTSGASWISTFAKITLPLLKSSFVAGWTWLFIHFIRELPISLLLAGPQNRVVAVTIYNYWEVGAYETLAAVSILLLILLYAVSFLSRRFGGSEVRME